MSKVVLVTGASHGLGKAIAVCLHQKGYRVYGTSRQPSVETSFPMLVLDVCNVASVHAAVSFLLGREGRIDVLINNAGIGMAGPLEQVSMENVHRVFDTNVFGALRISQAVLPVMRKQGKGQIIHIGSIGGEFGLPFRGVYSATKAALSMISDAMRFETGKFGIQTTTVLAGDMQTAINDHRIKDYRPGDAVYSATFEKVYAGIDRHVNRGIPSEKAAFFVESLLRKKALRNRYVVGPPLQRLSLTLKKILPAAWMERLLTGYVEG